MRRGRQLAVLVACALCAASGCKGKKSQGAQKGAGSGSARLEAAQRRSLTGRVVDAKRVPWPSMRVSVTGTGGAFRDDRVATTGPDGRFAIDGVPQGQVLITVYGDEHLPLGAELRTIGAERGDVGDVSIISARPSAAAFDPPFLMAELTSDDATAWRVLVQHALPPGVAAGLRDGDVILAINGTDVTGVRAVLGLSLLYASPGGRAELRLERGETITLVLAPRAAR